MGQSQTEEGRERVGLVKSMLVNVLPMLLSAPLAFWGNSSFRSRPSLTTLFFGPSLAWSKEGGEVKLSKD